ncbi:MAG TPA: hypothetical protein PKA64_08460 [Myxococcota bacterium]|nr:hypothetical protein [Myxococcota bacterium]
MSARPGKKGQEEPLTAQPIQAGDDVVIAIVQEAAEESTDDDSELRAIIRAQGEHIAALELRVEQLAESLATIERMVGRAIEQPMNIEQFEAAIKAGVREFMVLRDCRHTRIYMRAGTVLDARDYDMNMLADLIKHGRLQVRPKAS